MATTIPDRYLLFNELQTKDISIVVEIEGLPTLLSSSQILTRIRYGDPGIKYGDPGLVYGGLRTLTDSAGNPAFKSLLSKEGASIAINQKLEPEQGRAAISTISLSFVDKDKFMSQVISPGVLLPEILGRNVVIRVGYKQISYPEDYFVIFRGIVTQATPYPGKVMMQLSDANIKRRQKLFLTATTTLSAGVSDSDMTIPVVANGDFYEQILGPDGTFDTAVKTYIQINDEVIEYGSGGFGTNEFTGVSRGARGTVAVAHDAGDDVSATIEIEDHAIDLALKLMLSGWAGPYKTDVAIQNLAATGDPGLGTISEAIILPSGTDAKEVYGLTTGDYITIKNATNAGNNKTVQIIDFLDLQGRPNEIILTDSTFIQETGTPAVMDLRSQFDTLPINAGLKLTPAEVDVDEHIEIKNTFLLESENALRFYITDEEEGKSFLESQIYLAVACYSLTRFGRLSMGITKPPIADERLSFLTKDNILNPNDLAPFRGLNNRAFFNEVQFFWDATDAGDFTKKLAFLDSESLSLIGISSVLPISAKGARTDLGSDTLFQKRSEFLLSRYKRGAEQIQRVQVTYGVGNLIEAGDVVALSDNGDLQITNLETGERDIGVRLFEVVGRSIDYSAGKVTLDLIAGIGSQATDRFATISPSSELGVGSTTSSLKIIDSFGAIFPSNESRKWRDYIGNPIIVRPVDYSSFQETNLINIDPTDRFTLLIDPPLTGAPPSGFIVDIPPYPTGVDTNENIIYKSIHAFLDPTVIAVTGTTSQVEVPSADIGKFFVGSVIRVHDYAFDADSGDVRVTGIDVTGNLIFPGESLGFAPTGGEWIDLIGFPDEGGAYRWI